MCTCSSVGLIFKVSFVIFASFFLSVVVFFTVFMLLLMVASFSVRFFLFCMQV